MRGARRVWDVDAELGEGEGDLSGVVGLVCGELLWGGCRRRLHHVLI